MAMRERYTQDGAKQQNLHEEEPGICLISKQIAMLSMGCLGKQRPSAPPPLHVDFNQIMIAQGPRLVIPLNTSRAPFLLGLRGSN
jgi:hypothetical protein